MAPEVLVEALLGVYPQELPYDLYRQDLGVGELGRRATLAQLLPLEPIINEAENSDDVGAKIQKGDPLSVSAA